MLLLTENQKNRRHSEQGEVICLKRLPRHTALE